KYRKRLGQLILYGSRNNSLTILKACNPQGRIDSSTPKKRRGRPRNSRALELPLRKILPAQPTSPLPALMADSPHASIQRIPSSPSEGYRPKSTESPHGIRKPPKKFTCDFSGCTSSGFSRIGDKTRHMRTQHSDIRYLCDIPGCSMSFKRKDKLKQHMEGKHTSGMNLQEVTLQTSA